MMTKIKTTLAGDTPIKQFINKLKAENVDIGSSFHLFQMPFPKGGTVLAQAYPLNGGPYRLLLADARGWLLDPDRGFQLDPNKGFQLDGEIKLLPESEINKSIEYIRQWLKDRK
jgi:hypothetical protein